MDFLKTSQIDPIWHIACLQKLLLYLAGSHTCRWCGYRRKEHCRWVQPDRRTSACVEAIWGMNFSFLFPLFQNTLTVSEVLFWTKTYQGHHLATVEVPCDVLFWTKIVALAHTVAVKLGSPREFHSLTKIFFIKCQEEDFVASGEQFFCF